MVGVETTTIVEGLREPLGKVGSAPPVEPGPPRLWFLSLEITGRCQLHCRHCYADSGPWGDHGTMTTPDWRRRLEEAAAMEVRMVQLIGGEPTLHPDLPDLVRHGLDLGLRVEVYSNLARPIPERLGQVFALPGVALATSYHAADPETHDRVTGRRGSHRWTRANIVEALRRGIPLRVGVVAVSQDQDLQAAIADLEALGVAGIGVDRVREVGRGVRGRGPGIDQLCGHCGEGRLAISPNGEAWPCVFARWLVLGNVRTTPLADLHRRARPVRERLQREFPSFARSTRCPPSDGNPCGGPLCIPHLRPRHRSPRLGAEG